MRMMVQRRQSTLATLVFALNFKRLFLLILLLLTRCHPVRRNQQRNSIFASLQFYRLEIFKYYLPSFYAFAENLFLFFLFPLLNVLKSLVKVESHDETWHTAMFYMESNISAITKVILRCYQATITIKEQKNVKMFRMDGWRSCDAVRWLERVERTKIKVAWKWELFV